MTEKTDFKATIRHAKNYLITNISSKALSLLSIPILTRLLTTDEYGVINVFTSFIGIFAIIFTLNLHSAISRYYYENKDDFNDFFGTSIILVFSFTSLSFMILLLGRYYFAELFNIPVDIFMFFIPVVLFEVVTSVFVQIYTAKRESKMLAKLNIMKIYGTFILTVVIILLLNSKLYRGPIWASSLAGLIFSSYYLLKLKEYFTVNVKKEHVKYIFNYSIPLIPYALSGVIITQFDRIMINSYTGANDVGLYSFAYNLGMMLALVITSVDSAWMPKYFEYMNSKDYDTHDNDVKRIFRLISVAALFLILQGKEIGMVLAKKNFHEGLILVPIIVLSYLLLGMFNVFGRNIGYTKKTVFASFILLGSGILNVVLNSIFIPKYGYTASAYTTAVSYLTMMISAWLLCKIYLKVHTAPLTIFVFPFFTVFTSIAAFYYLENAYQNAYFIAGMKILLMIILSFLLLKDTLASKFNFKIHF